MHMRHRLFAQGQGPPVMGVSGLMSRKSQSVAPLTKTPRRDMEHPYRRNRFTV
jgi:hypothetical protein